MTLNTNAPKDLAYYLDRLNFSEDAYTVLLEFAVGYLRLRPFNIADYGIGFFARKEAEMNARETKRFSGDGSKPTGEKTICAFSGLRRQFHSGSIRTSENPVPLYESIALLISVNVFKLLTPEELEKIAARLIPVVFENGTTIFKEGDDVCGIFFVDSGQINLTSIKNVKYVIQKPVLRKGDHTDIYSIICYRPSPVTAVAEGIVKTFYLDVNIFEEIVGCPCSHYLTRSYNDKVASEKIRNNPHMFMLRYELKNFIVCYVITDPENIIRFGLSYFTEMKLQPGGIAYIEAGFDPHLVKGLQGVQTSNGIFNPMSVPREIQKSVEKSVEKESVIEHPKTNEERNLIKESITELLVFKILDEEQLTITLNEMEHKKVTEGEIIFKQGEEGDFFYVIQSGTYESYVLHDENAKILKTYNGSGNFGELALIHNTKRSTNIRAKTDGELWALSRESFKKIVVQSTKENIKTYRDLIEDVSILQVLNPNEKDNLAKALVAKKFADGAIITNENQIGDGMYFIISGKVEVIKRKDGNEYVVNTIEKGGYFGEMALLMKQPRAATVRAVGEVETVFLDADMFEKILGPSRELMNKNIERYQEQVSKILGSE